MYGNAQTDRPEVAATPIEQVSTIHQATISILNDANNALEALLSKVRGSQPSDTGKLEKMPERHVMADARTARDLAGHIFERVNDLHRYIGHDK